MDTPIGSVPAKSDVDSLIRTTSIPSISKVTLQAICIQHRLPKAGNKIDLQKRIISLISECAQHDPPRFFEVRDSIYHHARITQPPSSANSQTPHRSSPSMPPHNGARMSYAHHLQQGGLPQDFQFRHSPFYEIKSRLGELRTCEAMANHKHSVHITARPQDHPFLRSCMLDQSLRVMVLCAAGNTGVQDIVFPHQSELKVNGGEVKANLRGLKNKPGSTKPADITNYLRLKPPSYPNNIEFTYALTSSVLTPPKLQRHYIGIYACKVFPINQLVEHIGHGKRIPKTSVIMEITKKASDPDVIATSQILSLKCPLTYMRLKDPCRGLNCNHIQCFDATSYLQLQDQGPQWICPICSNGAPFDQLAVDEYVKDILQNTSSSVEQVTIKPNGEWYAQTDKKEESAKPRDTSSTADDEIVIGESSFVGSRSIPSNRLTPTFGTPSGGPWSTPLASRSAGSSSKRPAAEVIDLTLSDDDEPLNRPAKRQNTTINGWSGAF